MKSPARPFIVLFTAGIAVLCMSIVLPRVATMSDFSNGILKGISIGLLLLSAIVRNKTTRRRMA